MPAVAKHTNRLIGETSPYLLQHAHNPVDWYPWGPEAFEKARAEDKPIFLSVGYSACHWCHVMERESFENEEIAAILNEHFVSIKVDREERPDVDEIYMTAVQAMTGSGGWPMSVFLTPELEPFFGGTYYPPEDRYGRRGFRSILNHVSTVWAEKREDIERGAGELTAHMRRVLARQPAAAGELSPDLISNAVAQLVQALDPVYGGFGEAPKFPSSPSIALLLREYRRTGDEALLHAATLTLDRMATGGMYDHLGGGFARYSTDAQWLVPHFEKMLYDNAQLAAVYIEAYQLTGNPFYREVAEETFEYILREMTGERGEFYCAEDADSEGEEGKFYIWRHDELVELLGAEDAELFSAYYNVKPKGNFRSHESYHAGQNILHTPRDLESVAEDLGIDAPAFRQRLAAMEAKLLAVRSKRVRPGLDDKALASWNGMTIAAFARGYQVFGDERYRDAAVKAAEFILTDMIEDGALLHSYRSGVSKIPAYLDDYASVIVALIDLYEATFEARYLDAADELAQQMIGRFWDTERPGFYFTEDQREDLIVRTRPSYDGAVPSGNSVAAMGLLRLASLLDNADYRERAVKLLEAHRTHMQTMARGHLVLLLAADFYLFPPKEIAIAGDPASEGVRALLGAVHGAFVPNKVLALVDPSDAAAAEIGERIPLLAMKTLVGGKPAAYVCKDYACKMPVTAPEALAKELE